jgi:hypothetical protein
MGRLLVAIATTGVICLASQAHGTDPKNQSAPSKRQMIEQIVGCVKRQLAADKDSSYKEAMRVCKNQINKGSDHLQSDAVVASGNQAKP